MSCGRVERTIVAAQNSVLVGLLATMMREIDGDDGKVWDSLPFRQPKAYPLIAEQHTNTPLVEPTGNLEGTHDWISSPNRSRAQELLATRASQVALAS